MKFKNFAKILKRIEVTTARLEITDLLAKLYKELEPREGKMATYLLMGRLAPNYKGIELNLAVKLMYRVLAGAYNRRVEEIELLYKAKGDLGNVAYDLAKVSGLTSQGLSIEAIYNQLVKVAKQEGSGSVERKLKLMEDLLKKVGPLEAKYLVRVPVGALRLGFSEITILDALSWMLTGNKSLRPVIEKAFNVRSDIGMIVELVLQIQREGKSVEVLEKMIRQVKARPGIPIRPALAARLGSFEEIYEKLGQHGLEPKYDGLRTQVHAWKEEDKSGSLLPQNNVRVKIYSRNLENITNMFPEIQRSARELVEKFDLKGIILDSESIAFDPQTGQFYPFQETIKRKRKYGIDRVQRDLPIKTFVFDIMYFDEEDVINQPLKRRRGYLERLLKEKMGCLELTPQHIVDEVEAMKRWFNEYIDENLEGIMCKKLEAHYQAGSRNFSWVKFKPSALEGLEDTLDLVVMGWYAGRGKRSSFGIGAFLVGVYDRENDRYLTVSKIGTGLTDDQWREMRHRLEKVKVEKKPLSFEVPKELSCDFWAAPAVVVEIKADQITKSPLHTSGYALRFPRLVRFRDDKKPTQATTIKELVSMVK